ncbi:MAG: squalene--hopene cyclase [Pseudomonadota bacterium]|nr:squalene--hopene cyclase [Pseudomonadota bacterium]
MHKLKKIIKSFDSKLNKKSKEQNKYKLKEGCFVYELEADSTIPSEYILLMHFLGEINLDLEKKIKNYLLSKQNKDGGWPLYFGGESNISASVKAYYALKLSGISPKENLMQLAKKFIIKNGGAEQSNVFTRITLAQFGQISWEAVPYMPLELINFPKWFPFNIYKISYWSRTVLIPLLIIMDKKPLANNPNGVDIQEIFIKPGRLIEEIKPADNKKFSYIFKYLDKIIRFFLPSLITKRFKQRCTEDIYKWVLERLNGEDGLGGIFPAMVNALVALKIDEKQRFKKQVEVCKQSINNLIVENKNYAYCQPCVSPIWDTGWMGHVLLEKGNENVEEIVDWFLKKEITIKGDWSFNKKNVSPGGWAFQFNNVYYPDVDDTALVGMFLDRVNKKEKKKKISECLERTRKWIITMQSKNGGWGAFDIDNNKNYLNYIPFADHGALLDPPTVDVSARCLSFLVQQNDKRSRASIKKGLKYILSEQEKNGSWYGRWGTNYIYGTWSTLSALNLLDFPEKEKVFTRAINYLKSMQRSDGGWGEDGKSYFAGFENYSKKSTPSQTAWAIMGLVSAGQLDSKEVENGVKFLLKNNLNWKEDYFTAVGFPKVFYLKYHGYANYFPLLTIFKIKNLLTKNSPEPIYGV